MLRSNRVKIFVVFAVTFFQACGFWQTKNGADFSPASVSRYESKTEIPFSTKEPDVYQAEIVLTVYANGEKTERKIFTARSGEKLRTDYESKISFLHSDAGRKFLIHNGKKIYSETQTESDFAGENGDELRDFLTSQWLNEKADTKFENLGAENNVTKYRAVFESSGASETLIYVDENFKIPVRQEFYSITGERKNLVFSTEIRNLKLAVDEKLFELPKDFKKVSVDEFQKITRSEKLNSEK